MTAVGCEQTPTVVDTQISFQFPVNDKAAREEVVRLVVEAWPASLGVCEQFADWRQVVCNDTANAKCPDDIDLERRVNKSSQNRLEFTKTNGEWNFEALDLGEAQNIQVSIRGYGQDKKGLVYGCRGLELGENIIVSLSRPWCDQAVCLESFHPSCNAVIECNLQQSGTSSVSSGPVCRASTSTTVYVWEENGQTCDTIPTIFGDGARCQQAVVSCEAGNIFPLIDGICPAQEEACVEGATYPNDDLNCDGVAPVSECSCQPGEVTECETVPGCFASSKCGDDFQYGTCETITTTLTEFCDGIDSNCNLVADDLEQEANSHCTEPGPLGEPQASQCTRITAIQPAIEAGKRSDSTTTFQCTCGEKKRSCSGDDLGCCNANCVNLRTDKDNCGGCKFACNDSDSCCDAQCKNLGTDPANCGSCGTTCPDNANTCCQGSCVNVGSDPNHCGTCGTNCRNSREGTRCCNGQCTNTNSNTQHCGKCFEQCDPGQRCSSGQCVGLVGPFDGGLSTKTDAKATDSGRERIDAGLIISRDSGGR